MNCFKPIFVSDVNKASLKILNEIKDQLFFQTLSTITLQVAKQSGVQKSIVQQLSRCLQKVKGSSQPTILTFDNQNNQDDSNHKNQHKFNYDIYSKGITFKQQVNLLKKIQTQFLKSRSNQIQIKALQKYAAQKQTQLIPFLNTQSQSKKDRFKKIVNRKNKPSSTTQNYFKINSIELLKNVYHNQNNCYKMIRNFTLLKTVFGHSMDNDPESNCPLYNVLFDQTGSLIISGGEQGQIKIWNKDTGLLLSSLKGHQQYINKLQITKCNKYICSSGGDGIRFFLLNQMASLGGWKTQSIIDIASVYCKQSQTNKFLFGDKKNLYILQQKTMLSHKEKALTKQQFYSYRYSHRVNKQSFLLIIQLSEDQSKVLLGFETGDIILFHYNDLFTIDPIKQQTDPLSRIYNLPIRHILKVHRDEMRQLKWHQNNEYFVSGGKQGYCLLWQYKNQTIPSVIKQLQVSKLFNRRKKRAFGCNFINFNCTFTHFIAGFMQLVDEDDDDRGNGDLLVYSLQQKQLVFQFSKDMSIKVASVRGMDAHPIYQNIVLVCQGTGRILLIDFILKTIINTFQLRGFHLLHPQFCLNPGDCKFSSNGQYFVVSTQFGSISIFGYDIKLFYETSSSQQFFANDFISFSLDQNLRPIPIQGELQIDINRIQRGEITNIRNQIYQYQLNNKFQSFWKQNSINYYNKIKINKNNKNNNNISHNNETNKNNKLILSNASYQINYQNAGLHKNQFSIKFNNTQYKKYLQIIRFNIKQSNNFYNLYNKNIQQIQINKQSLLYQQKQKIYTIFNNIIENKINKLKSNNKSIQYHNNHNYNINEQILQHQNIKRLTKEKYKEKEKQKQKEKNNIPNYKDDNFNYNSANEQSYKASDQQQDDVMQLDYNIEDSDEMPYKTRRNPRDLQDNPRQHYKILRQTTRRNYNNQEQQQQYLMKQQQKSQKRLKRKNPAQDVQQMLKDQQYLNYQYNNGRKKHKRNKYQLNGQQYFINDKFDDNSFNYSNQYQTRTRNRTQMNYANSNVNNTYHANIKSSNNNNNNNRNINNNQNIHNNITINTHSRINHSNNNRQKEYSNINNHIRPQNNESSSNKRGRPKKNQYQSQQVQQSDSQIKFHRKRINPINQFYQSQHQSQQQQRKNHLSTSRTNTRQKSSNNKKNKNIGQCYRCGINPGTVKCNNCEIVCCQICKIKRGKQSQSIKQSQQNIFNCFVCIYINSTGNPIDQEKKISEQNYRLNERSYQLFIPQINDKVRFLFQGYQQFLYNNLKILNLQIPDKIPDYLLMPHIYTDIYGQLLLETPLCIVKNIKYLFPYGNSDTLNNTYKRRSLQSQKKQTIHMLINLELVLQQDNNQNMQKQQKLKQQKQKSSQQQQQSKSKSKLKQQKSKQQKQQKQTNFWIYYIPSPSRIQSDSQYLIRQQVYQHIIQKNLLQSLNANQTINIGHQQYQILQISPFQQCFPFSIYKQIKVSKSDGKRLRNINKQSQKRCNIWNIDSILPIIPYQTNITEQQQNKLLESIKQIKQQIPNYQLYLDFIDFTIYPNYRSMIQVGICLNLIQQRITNHFYNTINSLEFDLNHMVNNSIAFNGEDNQVTLIGKNIRNFILRNIHIQYNQYQTNNNNNSNANSNSNANTKSKNINNSISYLVNSSSNEIYQTKLNLPNKLKQHKIQQQQQSQQQPIYRLRNSLKHKKNNKHKQQIINEQSSQFVAQNIEIQQQQNNSQQSSHQNKRRLRKTQTQKLTYNHHNSRRSTINNNQRKQSYYNDKNKRTNSNKHQISVTVNTRTRRHDKINEDYDKQKQVYSNIKNRSRRQRYLESSHDSHMSQQKNQIFNNPYSTRRSNRLNVNH